MNNVFTIFDLCAVNLLFVKTFHIFMHLLLLHIHRLAIYTDHFILFFPQCKKKLEQFSPTLTMMVNTEPEQADCKKNFSGLHRSADQGMRAKRVPPAPHTLLVTQSLAKICSLRAHLVIVTAEEGALCGPQRACLFDTISVYTNALKDFIGAGDILEILGRIRRH